MSFLPSVLQKLLIAETESDQPVSSSIIQKVGGSINSIVDRFDSIVKFNSSGTFDVPLSTRMIYAMVVGGGGGGGGGGGARSGGGGGGGGGIALGLIEVTPGQALTITVGSGGVGATNANGADGGVSSIAGSGVFFRADGGGGGGGGLIGIAPNNFGRRGNNTRFGFGGLGRQSFTDFFGDPAAGEPGGGAGGGIGSSGGGYFPWIDPVAPTIPSDFLTSRTRGVSGGGAAAGNATAGVNLDGGASIFASGGAFTAGTSRGGGGGGAAFGAGGNGGATAFATGGSAGANSGGGGGGGGGFFSTLNFGPSTGGNGGSGVVWIFLSGA